VLKIQVGYLKGQIKEMERDFANFEKELNTDYRNVEERYSDQLVKVKVLFAFDRLLFTDCRRSSWPLAIWTSTPRPSIGELCLWLNSLQRNHEVSFNEDGGNQQDHHGVVDKHLSGKRH
jgi:hypothetical protein